MRGRWSAAISRSQNALLLRFPEPPSLAKDAPGRGSLELATQLFESDLLEGGWDSTKHPRTETANERRLISVKPDKGELTAPSARAPAPSATGELWRSALTAVRSILKDAAKKAVATGRTAAWFVPEAKVLVEATLQIMTPTELLTGEQRVIDQVRASVDPPKTLEALQQDPTENVLGYERHHIVEQNRDNVAKSPTEIVIEKFGWDKIDDPSNIVWVPRLKHELITAYYNSTDLGDPAKRLHRQVVNDMDFNGQREAGLAALRKFGVLQ